MRVRVLVGLICVLAFLLGHQLWTPRVSAVRLTGTGTVYRPPYIVGIEDSDRNAQPRLDLLGNEVDEAVGDYRVDSVGTLYERHSPDTALLKLGAPGV